MAKARKKFPPVPRHKSGVKPPGISSTFVPNHVAIVMDGNGRWAKERGLPRTAGHEAGELALLDAVYGALEIGVKYLTVYAFSTENWKRSPQEVKFLMNFNREVIHRRVEEMNQFGIKVRWSGREARLWKSVVDELKKAERKTYYAQYQEFMKTNPSLLASSDGFTSEQKYAITTKTLDFLKNVPRFSYSVNLGAKFGLNGKSTIEDVNNVIQKLGGYDVYMEWFNAGGPKFK